jgi:hypothetical protein
MKNRTLAALLLVLAAAPARAADADPAAVRQAVVRGLKRLEEGSASYVVNRQCFSCHHQAVTLAAFAGARRRGFEVEVARLREQTEFTLRTFTPNLERLRKGQASAGGSTQVAYALFALEAAGHAPDDTTAALVEYLLVRQRADGCWPALANRPPSEGSSFINVALTLRALKVYGPAKDAADADALRKRIETAAAKGRDWLLSQEPAHTEDQVGRLRGLVTAGADKGRTEAARDRLVREQRPDGGWAQLPERDSDAYATGTVLLALREAGVGVDDAVYRKGVAFLVRTQREGAWIVQTRSRPVQTFFDNGDPGGKSQFISFMATGWGVLALLETVLAR